MLLLLINISSLRLRRIEVVSGIIFRVNSNAHHITTKNILISLVSDFYLCCHKCMLLYFPNECLLFINFTVMWYNQNISVITREIKKILLNFYYIVSYCKNYVLSDAPVHFYVNTIFQTEKRQSTIVYYTLVYSHTLFAIRLCYN